MRKPRNESKLKRRIRTLFLTNPLMVYKTTDGKILTRDSAKVLVCIHYDIDDMFYFGYQIKTTFVDSYLSNSMNHVEIFSALLYLQKAGLIENLQGDKNQYFFTPTHEGMHFFELRRKNFLYLAINSVLIPIILAIITTLITLTITG